MYELSSKLAQSPISFLYIVIEFKVDRLQFIVVAKNISTCPNCSSVGCLKYVQFHNWFQLH